VNTADQEIEGPPECTALALGAGEYKAVQAGKPTRSIKSKPKGWFLNCGASPRQRPSVGVRNLPLAAT
jgi:hypothetical protein